MCLTLELFVFFKNIKNAAYLSGIYSQADMKRTFCLYSKRKTNRRESRRIRSWGLQGFCFFSPLSVLICLTMGKVFMGYLIFYLWNKTSWIFTTLIFISATSLGQFLCLSTDRAPRPWLTLFGCAVCFGLSTAMESLGVTSCFSAHCRLLHVH